MEILELKSIEACNRKNIIHKNKNSIIYDISKDKLAKKLTKKELTRNQKLDIDLSAKLTDINQLENFKEIVKPIDLIAENGSVCGFTMDKIKTKDKNMHLYFKRMHNNNDLWDFVNFYLKLEEIVKRSKHIVFPDLINLNNILVDESGNIHLIDCNGIQIYDHLTPSISVASDNLLVIQKYKYQPGKYYKKDLDKASLIYIFFLITFNFNLDHITQDIAKCSHSNDLIKDQVRYYLLYLGILDERVINAVLNIFNNHDLDYFGELAIMLATEYTLEKKYHPSKKNVYSHILKAK